MQRPNYFIVGAPKSGTTAVAQFLREHPQIFAIDPAREPLYFAKDLPHRRAVRDLEEYLLLFYGSTPKHLAVGEKSVFYLHSKVAATEIKNFNDDAKIIIMLRNPVDMMYALHSHLLLSADEDIVDFEEALGAEEDRAQGRRLPAKGDFPSGLLYRQVAGYTAQVSRFIEAFGRERLLILIFDDFKANPERSYRRALHFLEVDPEFQPAFNVVNPSRRPRSPMLNRFLFKPPSFLRAIHRASPFRGVRSGLLGTIKKVNIQESARPPIPAELRRRLQLEFADEVKNLSALLGRSLTYWTTD